MINPNTYYTVQAWMVNDLGLHGNELALYAIIWGFSQDGRSEFVGSISYIQEWLGCSRQTVVNTLKALIEKGLVVKKVAKNGFDCNAYKALPNPLDGSQNIRPGVVKNLDGGSQNIRLGVVKNLDEGSQNIRPNNNLYNNSPNNSLKDIGDAAASPAPAPAKEEKEKKPVKHKYGEYRNVLLTDEELTKLRQLFPNDLRDRIERLSEYKASTGKSYKSDYATIRSWANRDGNKARQAARGGKPGAVGPNGIAIDQAPSDMAGAF